MSTLKVNSAQIGQSLTATNNFTWYQPSTPDGTVRLGNGNAGSVTDLVTVNSSGNVGIGTSSPGTKLDIADASGGAPSIRLTNSAAGAWVRYINNGSSNTLIDSNVGFNFRVGASYTSAAVLDASGNLGLGVTPSAWFANSRVLQITTGVSIEGRTNDGTTVQVGANYYLDSSATYRYLTTNYAQRYTQSAGYHYWYTAPSGTAGNAISFTQAMTLDASGNLIVGATAARPSLGASLNQGNGTNQWELFVGNTSSTNASYGIEVYSNSVSAYRFQVGMAGTVYATSTSITAISDISLKENIRPLETGLAQVLALQPRRFDWKNGDGVGVAGFIAQEVIDVLPDLVSDYKYSDEETKKGLKMGDMIPTLVKAIQELSAELNELKAKVNA